MENNKGIEAVYASTRQEWRHWLAENSQSKKAICLIIHHKKSSTNSINYAESIEEALCYGWIDSKANKRDAESFYLQFTPRKPKSNWSKTNVERVGRMIAQGLMTEHGQKFIDIAKQTGKWPE
ncbi:YdeI family protein [Emticicia sp. C21]|uniref:YdeI/OmpD-associated family protein n=1 Tax=Emticicia sp. C21 TaxID=2302915 RepID=UPI000E3409B6|nr:hypothetical protein [Emticicia sp. C21]RFS17776.1 hypothetical protein D0T08_00565 [Emticicia sp. C21]